MKNTTSVRSVSTAVDVIMPRPQRAVVVLTSLLAASTAVRGDHANRAQGLRKLQVRVSLFVTWCVYAMHTRTRRPHAPTESWLFGSPLSGCFVRQSGYRVRGLLFFPYWYVRAFWRVAQLL